MLHRRAVAKTTKANVATQHNTFDYEAVRAKLLSRFYGNADRVEKVLARRRATFERRQRKADNVAEPAEQKPVKTSPTLPAVQAPVVASTKLRPQEKLRQVLLIKFDGDEAKAARIMSRRMAKRATCGKGLSGRLQCRIVAAADPATTPRANFEERMAAREEKLRALLAVQFDGDLEKTDRIVAKRKANIATRIARRQAALRKATAGGECSAAAMEEQKEETPSQPVQEQVAAARPNGLHFLKCARYARACHAHTARRVPNGHCRRQEGSKTTPEEVTCPTPALSVGDPSTATNDSHGKRCGRRGAIRTNAKGRGRHGRNMSHFHAHHLPRHQRSTVTTQAPPVVLLA